MKMKFSTKSLLVASMASIAAFSAINANAQAVTNGNWYELRFDETSGNWNNDDNWDNITNTSSSGFAPSYGFFEWANVSSSTGVAHATVNNNIPGIVVDGLESNPMSLYVGYNAGDQGVVTINSGGTLAVEFESARVNNDTSADNNNQNDAGWIVFGRQGKGTLNMNGGTLIGRSDITGDQGDSWMMVGSFDGGTGVMNMTSGTVQLGDTSSTDNTARFYIGRGNDPATGGKGTLNMSGGTIDVGSFRSFGAGDTHSHFSGTATLKTNELWTVRNTTITGHQVSITTGSLNLDTGSTTNVVVTANGASAINASGAINVNGTVNVDLTNAGASVGDSWMLVNNTGTGQATIGANAVVNTVGAAAGTMIRVNTQGGDGNDLVGVLDKALTLTVNRDTGSATITDVLGGVKMGAYRIGSGANGINGANLNPLGGDFDLITATPGEIVETQFTGSKTFSAGESANLGNIFAKPLPVGQTISTDNLTFQYLDPATNQLLDGIIEVSGSRNNLVLTVNKSTGEVTVTSDITKDIKIAGWGIKSSSGSLEAGNRQTLHADLDDGANSDTALSQSKFEDGVVISAMSTTSLGNIFDLSGEEDLEFEFVLVGEDGAAGEANGNFVQDGNSVVDGADLQEVADTFDEPNALERLFAVRNNINTVSEETRIIQGVIVYDSGVVASIPEPTTFALLGMTSLVLASRRKRA